MEKPAETALYAPNCSVSLLSNLFKSLSPLRTLFDLVHGMQDRRVVLAAELASNFRQRRFGEMLGQVHGNLPRIDDGTRIILGLDLDQAQAELLSYRLLNGLDRYLARLRVDEILQHLLRVGKRDFRSNQRGVRHQANQRAFQFADVGTNVLRR